MALKRNPTLQATEDEGFVLLSKGSTLGGAHYSPCSQGSHSSILFFFLCINFWSVYSYCTIPINIETYCYFAHFNRRKKKIFSLSLIPPSITISDSVLSLTALEASIHFSINDKLLNWSTTNLLSLNSSTLSSCHFLIHFFHCSQISH